MNKIAQKFDAAPFDAHWSEKEPRLIPPLSLGRSAMKSTNDSPHSQLRAAHTGSFFAEKRYTAILFVSQICRCYLDTRKMYRCRHLCPLRFCLWRSVALQRSIFVGLLTWPSFHLDAISCRKPSHNTLSSVFAWIQICAINRMEWVGTWWIGVIQGITNITSNSRDCPRFQISFIVRKIWTSYGQSLLLFLIGLVTSGSAGNIAG